MPTLDEPLLDSELEELNHLLLAVGERLNTAAGEEIDSVLGVSELDGFFTALASVPERLQSFEWLPALWDGHSPAFESKADERHLFELLVRHLNDVTAELQFAPKEFQPLFDQSLVDDEAQTLVDEWCYGYLRGVELGGEQWQPLLEEFPDILDGLLLFATPEGEEALQEMDDDQVVQLQALIPEIVRNIYAYWLERRTIRRETPKIGRNDPCPCGSGRKHKQCCMK